ncbi:MAG: D-aminoacyl-tRNA deacylase [bacterium]
MRAVIQRADKASVKVDNQITGEIGRGLLVFLGVGESDTESDIDYMANKVSGLRIFPDSEGKMNRSVLDDNLEILVVSQLTLYGDVKKGFRPSFTSAANPEKGNSYYERFCAKLESLGLKVEKGVFGAMMDVELTNNGPVTILIDSEKNF